MSPVRGKCSRGAFNSACGVTLPSILRAPGTMRGKQRSSPNQRARSPGFLRRWHTLGCMQRTSLPKWEMYSLLYTKGAWRQPSRPRRLQKYDTGLMPAVRVCVKIGKCGKTHQMIPGAAAAHAFCSLADLPSKRGGGRAALARIHLPSSGRLLGSLKIVL